MSRTGRSSERAETALVFLDLLPRTVDGREVSHGGGHDDDLRPLEAAPDGGGHLFGRPDGKQFHARRRVQVSRSRNQGDASAAGLRLRGDGVPHLPRGTVREEPDRIDVFDRGPGSDQHPLAFQALPPAQDPKRPFDNDLRRGQASLPHFSTGQVAGFRLHHGDSAPAQDLQIGLRRRVAPHLDVHGGSRDGGSDGGNVESAQEIVPDAVGEFGQRVGRRRRHQQQVAAAGQGDMFDGRRGIPEQVVHDAVPRELLQGQRPQESLGMLGHHREHLAAPFLKQSQDDGGLIGRDAAGDAQNDSHGISVGLAAVEPGLVRFLVRFFQDFPGDESLLRFLDGDVGRLRGLIVDLGRVAVL